MTLSLYDATIPSNLQILRAVDALLDPLGQVRPVDPDPGRRDVLVVRRQLPRHGAGQRDDLERAHGAPAVARLHPRRGGGVERPQPGVQRERPVARRLSIFGGGYPDYRISFWSAQV